MSMSPESQSASSSCLRFSADRRVRLPHHRFMDNDDYS
jgi:hypothetical protein